MLQALTDRARRARRAASRRRAPLRVLVLRLPDAQRGLQNPARALIDTSAGGLPLSAIARAEETDGPNRIGHENGRRRIVVYANTNGSNMGRVVAKIRAVIDRAKLPAGSFLALAAGSGRG